MDLTIIPIGDAGLRYLLEELAAGLSTARAVAEELANHEVDVTAIVGAAVSSDRLEDFRRGGIGKAVGAGLAQHLAARFPDALLVVELPLAKPEDASLGSRPFSLSTCNGEVYAATLLGAEPERVLNVVQAHDASFSYDAFVLQGCGEDELGCPREALMTQRARLVAAVCGAYDGEGFIVGSVRPQHA